MSVRVRLPISTLGGSAVRQDDREVRKHLSLLDRFSVTKPARNLGAVWTSDLVAQRKAVNMCEPCWRKYSGWWRREHYHPDWGWRYLGDCDGCGSRNLHVTLFHAEEMFYQVLGPQHGLSEKP